MGERGRIVKTFRQQTLAETTEFCKPDLLVRLHIHVGGVPLAANTSPARYSEPVMRMRAAGASSSFAATLSALSTSSRASAGMPTFWAISAKAAAGNAF